MNRFKELKRRKKLLFGFDIKKGTKTSSKGQGKDKKIEDSPMRLATSGIY